MKVSELEGALLNYWVAIAAGMKFEIHRSSIDWCVMDPIEVTEYSPSTDWEQGGPIIEQAAIGWRNATPRPQVGAHKGLSSVDGQPWEAWYCDDGPEGGNVVHQHVQTGATMLEACMRAYVCSKLGEEVQDAQSESIG